MTRKDVKEESDFNRRGDMSIIVWFGNFSENCYLLKAPRFPYKKRLQNKGHINLVTEVLKGFSPSVFNRLCVTHSKSSKNGNL